VAGVSRRVALLVVIGLVAAPAAHAEIVTRDATAGALAAGPNGSPRVAYVVGSDLLVAARAAGGDWTAQRAAPLPGPDALVTGLAVDGAGRATALAEDLRGRWLVVARQTTAGWRSTRLVRSVAPGAMLGRAGLTLDRKGRAAVAYALRFASNATYLRLARAGARGRFVAKPVTRKGFPPSRFPPSVTPVVTRGGAIHVLQLYGGASLAAAIEWRVLGAAWWGKFLYSTPIGSPFGGIAAAAAPDGTVYSAWTVQFPTVGETDVLLGTYRGSSSSGVALRNAVLGGLVAGPSGPELAADAVVSPDPDRPPLYAGLFATADGRTTELDGQLLGLSIAGAGRRGLLLVGEAGLSYVEAPARPTVSVSLTAMPGPAVTLNGTVAGGAGGEVRIYRESPGEPRSLVTAVPLASDGSFAAVDPTPAGSSAYRAVYELEGVPYASLTR
jgi:hypothetical protein